MDFSSNLSNSLTYVFKSQIGQRAKYTANTGVGIVSTANANLDGTGTLVTLLTPGIKGTIIKKIIIKATGNTTRGMIRFFKVESASNRLLTEIEIPAKVATSKDQSFTAVIEADFFIQGLLKASTENAESFIITVEGLDIAFP